MEALRDAVSQLPWEQTMSLESIAAATRAVVALRDVAEVAGSNHPEALSLAASVCALCSAATAMARVPASCFAALGHVISRLMANRASPSIIGEWTALLWKSEPVAEGISADATLAYFYAAAAALHALGTSQPEWAATASTSPAVFARNWTHTTGLTACIPPLLGWAGHAMDAAVAATAASEAARSSGVREDTSTPLVHALISGALAAQDALPNHFAAMNVLWKRTIVRAAVELLPPGPAAAGIAGTVLSRAIFWADAALQGFVPCAIRGGDAGLRGHSWDPASFTLTPEMVAPAWRLWQQRRPQLQPGSGASSLDWGCGGSVGSGGGGPGSVDSDCCEWNPWLSNPAAPRTLVTTLLFFIMQVRGYRST